jgi:hypothetical protein
VEPARDLLDRQDVDVGGQLVVQGPAQRPRIDPRFEIEMGHLLQGVDSRVGAPRAVDLEIGATRHPADHLVEHALDRTRVLLDLPAAVPGSDVLEIDAEAGHARATLAGSPVVRQAHLARLCYSGPA